MFWWLYHLDELNIYSIIFRLALAALFGGIVGIERGSKRRAAGFRTYMLVCIASALVMITNQYISEIYSSDPARLGAQVISGIGFLGAGTIIVTQRNQVKGLTTAAGLWASACFGLTVGIGFYEGAIIAGVFIFLVITGLHRLDTRLHNNSRNMELYVEFSKDGRLSDLMSFAHKNSIKILHVEFTSSTLSEHQPVAVLISIRLPRRHPHDEVVEQFLNLESVYYIEEM